MAEIGVDAMVEKMVQGTPPASAEKESPAPSAPTDAAPEQKESEREETGNESEPSSRLSAFDQELIEELDEEDRASFDSLSPAAKREALAFAKKTYRRSAKQMTELGTLRKAIGALKEAGITGEDIQRLVQSKRGGSGSSEPANSNGTGQASRIYDRWLSEAKDADERESLMKARQALREEMEDLLSTRLQKELHPLKERFELSDREAQQDRYATLEHDINALEDEHGYPGSLIETHRDAMHRLGQRHPKLSAEDLLVQVAGFEAVKSHLLRRGERVEKANGSGGVDKSRPPASVARKQSAQAPELPRNARGTISIDGAIGALLNRSKK